MLRRWARALACPWSLIERSRLSTSVEFEPRPELSRSGDTLAVLLVSGFAGAATSPGACAGSSSDFDGAGDAAGLWGRGSDRPRAAPDGVAARSTGPPAADGAGGFRVVVPARLRPTACTFFAIRATRGGRAADADVAARAARGSGSGERAGMSWARQ